VPTTLVCRKAEGVVVVALGCEMDDDVAATHQVVDEGGVGHRSVHELDVVAHRGQRGLVARVGECVEHGDRVLGVIAQGVVDEVGTDESGASGDEQTHRRSNLHGPHRREGFARIPCRRRAPAGSVGSTVAGRRPPSRRREAP
jgi:hypothetical protein